MPLFHQCIKCLHQCLCCTHVTGVSFVATQPPWEDVRGLVHEDMQTADGLTVIPEVVAPDGITPPQVVMLNDITNHVSVVHFHLTPVVASR